MAFACKKNITSDSAAINNLFTDTVPAIKLNEPQLLSFSNGNNASIVKWRVFPNSNYSISTAGIYASLLFRKAGVYSVSANLNNTQATYIITVSDSFYSDLDSGFSLRASKIVNVLPNEAVGFTVNNSPNSSGFVWTTTGNISSANTASNPAFFGFGSGSTGTVTLMVGNQTRSRTIWLANPLVNNPSIDTVPFIFFDKLIITPSVQKDGTGNKFLIITANTGYNYQGSTDSILNILETTGQEFTVNYGGVVMASVPSANAKPASCSNIIKNMSVGAHAFRINFGDDTYTGTVTLSASGTYTFNWANNNEVSIYPLVVQ